MCELGGGGEGGGGEGASRRARAPSPSRRAWRQVASRTSRSTCRSLSAQCNEEVVWVGRRPGNRLCGRPVSLQCQHAGRVQERVHIARVLRGERRCGGGSGRTCITSWMYCAASWPCTCILAVSISLSSTAHTQRARHAG